MSHRIFPPVPVWSSHLNKTLPLSTFVWTFLSPLVKLCNHQPSWQQWKDWQGHPRKAWRKHPPLVGRLVHGRPAPTEAAAYPFRMILQLARFITSVGRANHVTPAAHWPVLQDTSHCPIFQITAPLRGPSTQSFKELRDAEYLRALGGMRIPRYASAKLPRGLRVGLRIQEALKPVLSPSLWFGQAIAEVLLLSSGTTLRDASLTLWGLLREAALQARNPVLVVILTNDLRSRLCLRLFLSTHVQR